MILVQSGLLQSLSWRLALWVCALCVVCVSCGLDAHADTVTFFNTSQVATPVASGPTWDSVSSGGYLFTFTRDKFFTGGGSVAIGRSVRVDWPEGIEAQAVTAGPSTGKAKLTIERLDGGLFDLTAFDAKLLANTFGAGGSFEVVAFLNGEEFFQDPIVFGASGSYGQVFSYDTSPSPLGSTILLKDFDKYSIDLYVDFAVVGLTLRSAAVLGDANGDGDLTNQDIASFVLALINPVAYQTMFPDADADVVLDMNGDGVFSNLDIADFVAALTGGGTK